MHKLITSETPRLIPECPRRQAASLRSPSQSVRNPTTEFQLGVMRDAGPEIANGLGAFPYVLVALQMPSSDRGPRPSVSKVNAWREIFTLGAARDGLLDDSIVRGFWFGY